MERETAELVAEQAKALLTRDRMHAEARPLGRDDWTVDIWSTQKPRWWVSLTDKGAFEQLRSVLGIKT